MSITVTSTSIKTPEEIGAESAASAKETKAEKSEAAAKAEPAEKTAASETTKQEHETEASEKTEETESEEETEEVEVSPEGEQTKKPLKGFKKRIDKLNKRASAAEERAIRAEERARVLEEQAKGKQETKQVETKKETVQAGKPKADDFASHDAFLEALTDWKVDQREKQKDTRALEVRQSNEQMRLVGRYKEGAKAAKEKFADYDDVIEANETPVPRHITGLLYHSENGAELSYHLAKNESEFARICKLDQVTAARELGKFEAKHISAPESKETKETKTTKAPAPINPVGAKSSASSGKSIWDADKMSQSEYEAMRAKQRAKKGA